MRKLVLTFVLFMSSVVSAATTTCSQENLEELFRTTHKEMEEVIHLNVDIAKLIISYDKMTGASFQDFKVELIKVQTSKVESIKVANKAVLDFIKKHPECNIDNFVTTTYKTK